MTESSIEQPVLVALTGGIGSGKSTVAARLRELGAVVIEADALGHAVLEPDGAAFEAVASRWPGTVTDGRIDRARLARIVFADPEQLAALEAMTHPAIKEAILRGVQEATARVVVVEIPVPDALPPGAWTTVVVAAPLEARLERAVARGNDAEDARRRATIQRDDESWQAAGDIVVPNTGSLPDLMAQVDRLWMALIGESGVGGSAGA